MRNLFFAAIVVAVLSIPMSTEAEQIRGTRYVSHQYTTPQYAPYYAQNRGQYCQPQPNVFQRLIELERRKNRWLLKTFFGYGY